METAAAEAKLKILYGLVKLASMIVGLIGSLLSLMALVGAVTERLWLRLGVAVIVALIVPLAIADRLIPAADPKRARGLPTDVLALVWLGSTLAVAFFGGVEHG